MDEKPDSQAKEEKSNSWTKEEWLDYIGRKPIKPSNTNLQKQSLMGPIA